MKMLSANQYSLRDWATRVGWPCSVLAECSALTVTLDDNGDLLDIEHRGVDDIPADELAAWIDDQLTPDEEEQDTPDDDDDYIADDRTQGYAVSHGSTYLGTFPTWNRAASALYLARAKSSYYPNIWYRNDHGNVTLHYFDSHVLRATDTAYV